MAHHLLLCLGKGQAGRSDVPISRRQYDTTTYFCPDRPESEVVTPFVGEAILGLYQDRFTDVHIFGTADSMWDTLYSHLLNTAEQHGEGYTETEIEHDTLLRNAVNARTLEEDDSPLRALEERFGRRHGVRCTCRIIPLPRTDADFWRTLQIAAGAGIVGGQVSIDITHGFRVQPFFLLVTLLYLRAVRDKLNLGTAFYGARDMMGFHDGRAPLYEQNSLLALLDWIDAARAFDRYGDATPVANLLGDHRAKFFSSFSEAIQLNALRDLQQDAKRLYATYSRIPEDAPAPFEYLLPRMMNLPAAIAATKHAWEAKMLLAIRHAEAQNLGLAVLAAYEAVLDRIALAYGLKLMERRDQDNASTLKAIAYGEVDRRVVSFYGRNLPAFKTTIGVSKSRKLKRGSRVTERTFGEVVAILGAIRNAIAHADEGLNKVSFEPPDVYRLLQEGLFTYLHSCLSDSVFDELPRVYSKHWNPGR